MTPTEFIGLLTQALANYGQQFAALAGTAALIAALVNASKTIGWVADGQAPKVSLVLNALGFVGLLTLRLFRPEVNVEQLDGYAAEIATFLVGLVGLVGQVGGTKVWHLLFKGLPVIGKSYTEELYTLSEARLEIDLSADKPA